jgi:2-methylcitrate dehydratase PrpD
MALQTQAPATQDFAQTYAEFSSSLEFADLSAATVAGVTAEGATEVRDLVRDWGGKPEAQVLWRDLRIPAPMAAWINGIMAHARDYDDVHEKAIVHAGVSNLPVAIAAADAAGRPVTGRDFYTGLIAGMELTTRMGAASTVGVTESGFIYLPVRLLRRDRWRRARPRAVGRGDSKCPRNRLLPGGRGPSGNPRRRLDQADAAGFRGPGRADVNRNGRAGRIRATEHLRGRRWRLEDLSYKPYPSCRFNHTAIDAALRIRSQPGFDRREVTAIRAYQTVTGREVCGTPVEMRQNPATLPQAQFNICYNVACALVSAEVGVADFADPAALLRPDVATVTCMVVPLVDDEVERGWGRNVSPTRLEVETPGRFYTARVDFAKGSLLSPFTAADRRRKLEDCLRFGGFDRSRADVFDEVIDDLIDSADVSADFRGLTAEVTR